MKDLIYCGKCQYTIINKYTYYPYKFTLYNHLDEVHEMDEIIRFMDRAVKKYNIKNDSYFGQIIEYINERFNDDKAMYVKRKEFNEILYLVDNIKHHYRNFENEQYFIKMKKC